MRRKLFISFTGLISSLHLNKINKDDLKDGLFYFGCAREYAFNPGCLGSNDCRKYYKNGKKLHEIIVAALLLAEKDGRAIYRDLGKYNTFDQLNELLASNGFGMTQGGDHDYNYYDVERRVREANLDLDVIF